MSVVVHHEQKLWNHVSQSEMELLKKPQTSRTTRTWPVTAVQTLVSTRPETSDVPKDLVCFRVDGERFEILEQTVRAKGETLLCTMLDDPQRTGKEICAWGLVEE